MAVDQFQEAVAYQKGNAEYHYQLGKAYLIREQLLMQWMNSRKPLV